MDSPVAGAAVAGTNVKPKLLHVVSDFLPFGYGEQAALLVPAFSEPFDIRFGSTSTAGLEFLPGGLGSFPLSPLPSLRRNWLGAAWALRRLIRRERIDLLHAWGAEAARVVDWALAGLSSRSVPRWIVRYHRDNPPTSDFRWMSRLLEPIPLPSPPLPGRGQSDGAGGFWGRLLGQRRRPQLVVDGGNGPDADCDSAGLHAFWTFDARETLPAERVPGLRAALQVDDSVPLVGVVSPFEVRCGLKHLVWATDLAHWVRDLRLVLWGSGSQQADLQRYARQIASRDHYLWLPPASPIRQQLLELNVLWDPSRSGLSPASLTAIAHGIPVVTFAPESALDPQLDRNLVRCVPWGARDELARATIRLLEQGAESRNFRAPSVDNSTIAAAYAQLYNRLVGG